MNDDLSLSHTRWNCKYHIVFIPKYRRKEIYGDDRLKIISHGGLPAGLTKEDFFRGISKPRNEQLADIFKRLGIVEQTGHGVPTIIKKYGENAFDIKANYINVVIPFDKEVIANHGAICGAISGVNSGFNKGEQSIIDLLKANPNLSTKELSQTLNIPFRSIQRYISHLKDKGAIRRNGSNKTGYWEVL